MNKLINIEGIDGSGKTSIVNKLEELSFKVFKEIPKTINQFTKADIKGFSEFERIGYDIRLALQNSHDNKAFREMLACKYVELRKAYQPIIEDMLKDSDVIIDRGMLSTMVYGYSSDEDFNSRLAGENLNTKRPDIIIYLDIDIETALKRLQGRNDNKSEAYKNEEVMVKNLKTYNLLIEKYKDLLNIKRVEAKEDLDVVLNLVLNMLGD